MRKIKREIVINALVKICGMFLTFWFTRLIVERLGTEKYGVWANLISFISWMEICDMGIGNGLRNALSKAIELNDRDSIKVLISSAYKLISAASLILLIVLLIISYFVNWNRLFGYKNEDENINFIVIVLICFIVIHFVLSLINSVLYARQKAYIVNGMMCLVTLLNLLALYIFSNQNSLLFMVTIYGINLNVVVIIASCLFYRENDYRPSLKVYNPQWAIEILRLGLYFFFIQIVSWVLSSTDGIIIGYYYSSEAVTPYSLVNKILVAGIGICSVVTAPLWSAFTKAMVSGLSEWMNKVIRSFNGIFIIISLFMIGVYFLIPFIVKIWTGVNVYDQNRLILIICFNALQRIWCDFYSIICNGLECLRENLIIALIEGISNIPLSIFLCKYMNFGIEGVVLGTVIAYSLGMIVLPMVVNDRIRLAKV